jgi:exodeoxyribonuclease V alpha subunit
LNYKKTDIKRLGSLAFHTLNKLAQEEGHTYLTIEQLIDKMVEVDDDIAEELIPKLKQKYIETINSNKEILREKYKLEIIENKYITTTYFKYAESWIDDWVERKKNIKSKIKISKKAAEEYIEEKEEELGIKLSKEQKQTILSITTEGHSLFILCGYAGTGKSTISKIILDFYSEYVGKENIITTAFTGMASKRIKDTSGYNGKTIHSLLEFDGKTKRFKKNEKNKLPQKVILIDEASMVNLSLMYHLLKAIEDNSIVIMVGDDAQLPPIGEGNVFADLLSRNDVPKVKLTKIFRQSEDSVVTYFADHIRKGEIPPITPYHHYKDAFVVIKNPNIKKDMDEKQKEKVKEKFYLDIRNSMLNDIKKVKSNLNYIQAITDIQIIAPQKKGLLGTDALNEILQGILNPNPKKEVKIRGFTLKLHDKVIHLKNENMPIIPLNDDLDDEEDDEDDYDIDIRRMKTRKEARVFNGSVGIVVYIDEENEEFIVDYGIYKVIYSFDHYKDIIDLGYALTIHKTQGSQFKYVFLPILNSSYIMLNNKLLYTAITRTKEKLFLYTQSFALKHACTNINQAKRQTFLSNLELLKNIKNNQNQKLETKQKTLM